MKLTKQEQARLEELRGIEAANLSTAETQELKDLANKEADNKSVK